MLLELKVKNFKSIRDWQTFSMLAETKVKEMEETVIKKSDSNILSSAIIYGRNASGKSNILNAFRAFQYLVLQSADFKVDEKIAAYQPYKLDNEGSKKPVELLLDFIAKDGIRYVYSIGFGKNEIIYEKLVFYPKLKPALLVDRVYGKPIKYGEYLTGKKKEIESLLYPNQLFLSKVGTEKNEKLKYVYEFFSEYLFTSTIHDSDYDHVLIHILSKKMGNNDIPHFNKNVNQLIQVADTGINEVKVKEEDMDKSILPKDMSDEEKEEIVKRFKYKVRTVHKLFDGEEEKGSVEFRLSEESTGTIKLLAVGGLILEALSDGMVLIVDELDKSLHPKLTRALINIFKSKKNNPNNAQLIFATHDVSLLDSSLFRRDQVWFAEKEYEGNSHYYSLSDIQGVRKGVPYEKWYMTGRFGAMPAINEFDLNFAF